jgi:hypothetical protein
VKFIFDQSLTLYLPLYRLNGDSFGSCDACGHMCTVSGAPYQAGGRLFDGVDDQISCGNSSALNASDAITIEVWIKPGVNFTTTYYQIVDKRNGSIAPTMLWAGGTTQRLVMYAGGICAMGTVTQLSTGKWYHVAGTAVDGTTSNKIFINGNDDTASTGTATFATNTADLVIGKTTTGGNPFHGTIGEVRIYRRALTPEEVNHNYLDGKWRYQ